MAPLANRAAITTDLLDAISTVSVCIDARISFQCVLSSDRHLVSLSRDPFLNETSVRQSQERGNISAVETALREENPEVWKVYVESEG